jgi:hypothetical protein
MAAELTDTQIEYLEWRSNPSRSGTKRQWAIDHGVDPKTLRRWEQSDWFREELEAELRALALGPDAMLEVAVQLQRDAAAGDGQATRQYLALVEKLNPTREAPRESRAVEQLTDAELEYHWREALAA